MKALFKIFFVLLTIGVIYLISRSPAITIKETLAYNKPNFVFILTDDLDLSGLQYMPKIKALIADAGITFSNFFISNSLCCPSRSSILRGQYGHNTKVMHNIGPEGGFQRFHTEGNENSTVATWLKAAGYRTGIFGKYLNGYPNRDFNISPTYIPPGWDQWFVPIIDTAYNSYKYIMNQNGLLVYYGSGPSAYITDVISNKATNFIKTTQTGKPFFAYITTYAPHSPSNPAPRHVNMTFNPMPVPPTPPSFNEADVSDKPIELQRILLPDETIATGSAYYLKKIRSLQAIDDLVEAVINALTAKGVLNNTYVIFTSDNGFHLGIHRLIQGKTTAYEEDIRVPFVVRGPGLTPCSVRDDFVGNIDLAPTFAQLAGVTIPDWVDGRSFVTPSTRKAYLLEHGNPPKSIPDYDTDLEKYAQGIIPAYAGLRTTDWMYTEYVTGSKELYNLVNDPYELENKANQAEYADIQNRLATKLSELSTCAGSSCRTAEDTPF
ncbi:MAG: sulfatase [Candidatus Gottesmanbacteria bacterium]